MSGATSEVRKLKEAFDNSKYLLSCVLRFFQGINIVNIIIIKRCVVFHEVRFLMLRGWIIMHVWRLRLPTPVQLSMYCLTFPGTIVLSKGPIRLIFHRQPKCFGAGC